MSHNSSLISSNSEEISLKDVVDRLIEIIRFLKKNVIKIVIIGFIGGLFGYFYASKQPTLYSAKLTFVVEEGKNGSSNLGGLASLAGQFGVDVGSSSGTGLLAGENILLYLKSPSLAREVLLSKYDNKTNKSFADVYAELYLLKNAWELNKSIGKVDFHPLTLNKPYSRLQDSLLQSLARRILKSEFSVAKADKKAGFIDVITKMENENLAKVYCERIVNEAVDRYVNIKTTRQKNTVQILQLRVDSVARLLNQKTASSASIQTSLSTMDINPLYKTGTVVATETTVRDKTMLATIFVSISQNLELAKFNLSQETPVIQVVDLPLLPLPKEKISKLNTAIIFSFISSLILITGLAIRNLLKSVLA